METLEVLLLEKNIKEHIVVGDMNINIPQSNQAGTSYLDVVKTNGYRIVNKINEIEATRWTENIAIMIDHVIKNTEKHIILEKSVLRTIIR